MEFKPWYYLQEVIDDNDYKLIQNNLANIYDPEKIKLINAEIEDLRKDPRKFRIKDVMDVVRKKYPAVKEKTQKLDNMVRDYQRRTEVTPEEVETLKYFFDQDVPSQSLDEMMRLLRDFLSRELIDLKIENGKPELYKRNQTGQTEKTNTPDFTQFISVLHGIQGSFEKIGPANKYYDPRREYDSANLVAQGDNIWVYKGTMPELCRKFGKGQKWCIASSSTTQHYFDYRLNYGQTQYFIFDFNKAVDDPARYVNPGVAPPGKYSEWVDFTNNHSEDPEEPNSHFGINGYRSINDYKRYLKSKGIDPSVFVADPIQDWEKRLNLYVRLQYFLSAKNDAESEKLWPSFLKLVEQITDVEFDSLSDEEKKMYVLRKWLTDFQTGWAFKNYKQEYLKSLESLQPVDEQTANFIINNNRKLSILNVLGILQHLPDLSDIEERIGSENLKKINQFSDEQIFDLLDLVKDEKRIVDLLVNYKELTPNDILIIFKRSEDIQTVAEQLGEENLKKINQMNDEQIDDLSKLERYKDGVLDLVLNYKELTGKNIADILKSSHNLAATAKIFGKENLKKINLLDYGDINYCISGTKDKAGLIDLILNHYEKDLSLDNIYNILLFHSNLKDIEAKLGKENLQKINQFAKQEIDTLLTDAKDKEGIRYVIYKYKD